MTIQRKKSEARKFLETLRGGELTFGRMIKSLRHSDAVSQTDLAKVMGITRQTLNDIESGRSRVDFIRAAKFALVMGYSVAMFLKKSMEDKLQNEGFEFEISRLIPAPKFSEKELVINLCERGEFKKFPRNTVLRILIDRKVSRQKAEVLVSRHSGPVKLTTKEPRVAARRRVY